MSRFGPVPVPGSGRIALVLLAVVPAVMAYPWQSTVDFWLLGVAVVFAVALLGWRHGLHYTTILRRWLAIVRRRGASDVEPSPGAATTALLRVRAAGGVSDQLPLPLIARYLHRYGIRAKKIRITNCGNVADASPRDTWIGITLSAGDNLAALRARSSRIPLQETTQVVVRRLADHLREVGWDATTVKPDKIPRLFGAQGHEKWRALEWGESNFVVSYKINVDEELVSTLAAVHSVSAHDTCIALELAGDGNHITIAAACAFVMDALPEATAPTSGLGLQQGNQRLALMALELCSTRRLEGHTDAPTDLLTQLRWPTPANGHAGRRWR